MMKDAVYCSNIGYRWLLFGDPKPAALMMFGAHVGYHGRW